MGRCILQGSQKDDSYVFLKLLHYRSTLFTPTICRVSRDSNPLFREDCTLEQVPHTHSMTIELV